MFRRWKQKTLLIIFLFVFIPFAGIVSVTATHLKKTQLLEMVAEEERNFLVALIHQRSASLQTFVDDYGYWDDLVRFLDRPNRQWAAANIVPCLDKFDADAIWLYDIDAAPAYSVCSDALGKVNIPLAGKNDIGALFTKARFCHFFVRTTKGVLEIRGSTVHATLDPERKTVPKGYLFAGRLWTGDYIVSLSKLWKNRIDVIPQPVDALDRLEARGNTITFSHTLHDGIGLPAAQVITSKESSILSRVNDFSSVQFALSAVFLLSSLGLAAVLLNTVTGTRPAAGMPAAENDNAPDRHEHAPRHEHADIRSQQEIESEFLALRSRIIKRADFQSLDTKTLRMERFELENRIKQRMSELIQSYDHIDNDPPHQQSHGDAERRLRQRPGIPPLLHHGLLSTAAATAEGRDVRKSFLDERPSDADAIETKDETSPGSGAGIEHFQTDGPLIL